MKLQNLKIDFASLNQKNQEAFFFSYYKKRGEELSLPSTFVRKKKVTAEKANKDATIKVTLSQLELLKKLGLVK